jgi:oxalate decarboxylase/phosphoglucose isomerase-like protein (cupin superfamily)
MEPKFEEIFTSPENSVFQVVFFPDRIYHAQYLNATRSSRYRYNVQEVRTKGDANILKGEVYLDGRYLTNFLRIEYHPARLTEITRLKSRFLGHKINTFVKLLSGDSNFTQEANVTMHYCDWISAYQVEIWESLEAPQGSRHDFKVISQMGKEMPITRVPQFSLPIRDIKQLKKLQLAFSEYHIDLPFGNEIDEPQWDNNFFRSHQEPRTNEPSSQQNTIKDWNYEVNFQRGWFLNSHDVQPVRYLNAMMEAQKNEDARPDNVIEMRWILQREFGGKVAYFHEVNIPPGKVEGTHHHIGSEELYYIVEGEGIGYMAVGDDPSLDAIDPVTNRPKYPTVEREIFGIGRKACKELPIGPGSVIYTKSGGFHGIRNTGDKPLKFVAFLYHCN